MEPKHSSATLMITFFFFLVISHPLSVSSQAACQRSCGKVPLKYPFGSGTGCGDPRFQKFITCNNNDDQSQKQLTLKTQTGCYPVTSIDYSNQVIYITDPSMSTCACTQPSKGFSLDWDAPFSFQDDTVFTLLDCSINSSPIYRSSFNDSTTASVPLCDKKGASICSYLYSSCRAISLLNLPISTCCVYTPVDLGPSFELDLQKLQCSSYSGFYSFSGQEYNPENWKYGIALKYKFNVYNEYPSSCANCEKSAGACAYSGPYNSFICNCPNGINTTTDCYFEASFNNAPRLLPAGPGTWLIIPLASILILFLL